MLGQPSDGLTLCRLSDMVRQIRREAWGRTAAVMALLANCNRDPAKRATPYTPDDFDPYAEKQSGRRAKMSPEVRRMIAARAIGKTLDRPPGRWDRLGL